MKPEQINRAMRDGGQTIDWIHNVLHFGSAATCGTVTLRQNETTTTVEHNGVSSNSHIDLSPTNAAMATEWATTVPYVSSKTKGSFVITHANAATDRTLSYAFRTPIG